MKIKYEARTLKYKLIYGLIMIIFGTIMIIMGLVEDKFKWTSVGWVVMGILQTGMTLYEKKNQYLTIKGNKLTRHSIIPRTIEIDKIKKVRKFVNSYKIETSDKILTIDKGVIENESLYQLTDYLNTLKLKV